MVLSSNTFKTLFGLCLVVGFAFHQSIINNIKFISVRTITLSSSNVQLPARWPVSLSYYGQSKSSQYVFGGDKSGYHLYFVGNGASQEVVGDPFNSVRSRLLNPNEFGGFIDVPSSSGVITYTSYAFYNRSNGFAGTTGNESLADSGLYVIQGNRIQRILSDMNLHGIWSLDAYPQSGEYLDKRGNLYVMTLSRVLCVIRDGKIVGKADISRLIGPYAEAGMFSDNENTYFLVPKMFGEQKSENSFNEDTTEAKYRIKF